MIIFFDTEFTGLVPNTTLISLGMVAETGEKFYAEFTDYDTSLITPWIADNVFVSLGPISGDDIFYIKGDTESIKDALEEWLVQIPYERNDNKAVERIQLVGDVPHYDMVLLCNQLFGGAMNLPHCLNPVVYDICHEMCLRDLVDIPITEGSGRYFKSVYPDFKTMPRAFNMSRQQLCKALNDGKNPPGKQHNALYDAELIKMIYEGFRRLERSKKL